MKDTILGILASLYPKTAPGLNHTNAYESLVATILSAQCTDVRVNKITPALFRAYPNAHALAEASEKDVAQYIKTAGLWKTKSRNLVQTAKILVEKHGGEVPRTRQELKALPGVGRKTANVVLSNAFGIPAMAVDTHVFRVANRLGLADAKNPRQAEEQLMAAIPKDKWIDAHRWLIYHGRALCKARNPLCKECPLADYCPAYQEGRLSS
ncbi:MAG TPA: endonuclease III [Firmicutes bacterium]|nr:endonuclease III [Bacillota bacterium]